LRVNQGDELELRWWGVLANRFVSSDAANDCCSPVAQFATLLARKRCMCSAYVGNAVTEVILQAASLVVHDARAQSPPSLRKLVEPTSRVEKSRAMSVFRALRSFKDAVVPTKKSFGSLPTVTGVAVVEKTSPGPTARFEWRATPSQ
jgi:hypothetical protein